MKMPDVGSLVYVKTLPPFDNVSNNVHYRLVASQLISTLVKDGADVLTDVYLKVGLTVVDMNNDAINGIPLITLNSGGTRDITIPLNRLEFRNYGGKDYVKFGIGVNVGSLPVDTDFADIQREILLLVRERLGVNAVTNIVQMSREEKVTLDDHEYHLDLRSGSMTNTLSAFSQIDLLNIELDTERVKVKKLYNCLQSRK
jgi:hypothetical protein